MAISSKISEEFVRTGRQTCVGWQRNKKFPDHLPLERLLEQLQAGVISFLGAGGGGGVGRGTVG